MLESFPVPRPTTNPYIVMLARSLQEVPALTLVHFSWRAALVGRWDVFHAHWPEILVSGRTPARRAVRQLLFLLLLVRLRTTRRPLVRTMHNLKLPEGLSRTQTALLRLAERWTSLRILINDTTELPPGQESATILHGHYRDWFAQHPSTDPVPGRLAFFGLIRRYKGVDTLIDAFREMDDPTQEATLQISGKPSNDELSASLTRATGGDARISLHLEFLSDAELVRAVTSAQLIVLPYREMHNSGGALTALSLSRPVLVPDNTGNRRLAAEVGEGWVHLYDTTVTGRDLHRALHLVSTMRGVRAPDLSAREWHRAGTDHLAAFRRAVAP